MIALSLSDINLSFGHDVILKDISFSVNDGDRVGVIGVNGAGKTSLFRVITGEYSADSGAVYVQKGHTLGVLEQNPNLNLLPSDATVLEYMYTAFPRLISLEKEISDKREEYEKKTEEYNRQLEAYKQYLTDKTEIGRASCRERVL